MLLTFAAANTNWNRLDRAPRMPCFRTIASKSVTNGHDMLTQLAEWPHPKKRLFRLIVLAAPAIAAVLLAVWPSEWGLLQFACAFLGLVTIGMLMACRSISELLVGTTTIAVLLSVITTNWPLQYAYRISYAESEAVARRVAAGQQVATPCWIGVFRIETAEVYHNGVVCLWTNDAAAGPTGFVQYAADDLPFNLANHFRLDDQWQFISED